MFHWIVKLGSFLIQNPQVITLATKAVHDLNPPKVKKEQRSHGEDQTIKISIEELRSHLTALTNEHGRLKDDHDQLAHSFMQLERKHEQLRVTCARCFVTCCLWIVLLSALSIYL